MFSYLLGNCYAGRVLSAWSVLQTHFPSAQTIGWTQGEESSAENSLLSEKYFRQRINICPDDQKINITSISHLGQALEGVVGHHPDLAAIEEHRGDAPPPDEAGVDQLTHVVPVEVHRGGVHGDQGRDIEVAPLRALDDVVGPTVVVVASTTLRRGYLSNT